MYILRTDKDTLYIGQTKDLQARLKLHKAKKGAKYLRYFKNFVLVYKEELENRGDALRREAELKKLTRKEKDILINPSLLK